MKTNILNFLYYCSKTSLGLAFILSGIRKLPGIKFTQLPIDNPVGLFFEGMYAAGFYWNFIGIYQIVVGSVLVVPYWSKLTPILSIPVTVNIFLISVGLSMKGTPIITAMMLMANLYLLFYHRKSYGMLFEKRPQITIER